MWFLDWIDNAVREHTLLAVLLGASFVLLLIAAIVSALTDRAGIYVAFAAIAGGVLGIVVILERVDRKAGTLGMAGLTVFSGFLYFIVFIIQSCRRHAKEKQKRKAELWRRLQYTLPEKDNSYIRARLNTVLRTSENTPDFRKTSGGEPVRLGYARKLLAKVQEAPLTAAERLQAEDIGRTFSLYLSKERWDATDLRTVNDTFSCLLKLSAKYAVEV